MLSSSDSKSKKIYGTIAEESKVPIDVVEAPTQQNLESRLEDKVRKESIDFVCPSDYASSSDSSPSQGFITHFSTSQELEIPKLSDLIPVKPKSPDIFEPPSPITYRRGVSQFGFITPIKLIKKELREDFQNNKYLSFVQKTLRHIQENREALVNSILQEWLNNKNIKSCQMTYSMLNLLDTKNIKQNEILLQKAILSSDCNRILPMLQFGFIVDTAFDKKTGIPKKIAAPHKEVEIWLDIASKVHAFRIMASSAPIGKIAEFIQEHKNTNSLRYEYKEKTHKLKGKVLVRKTIEVIQDQFFDAHGIIYLMCLSIGGASEIPYRVHRLCSSGNILETLELITQSDKKNIMKVEFTQNFCDGMDELCGYNKAQSNTIRKNILDAQQKLSIQ